MLAPYLLMVEAPELVMVTLRFQINSGSDPDNVFPAGSATDVIRVSAGLFDIVLPTKWIALVSCTGTVQQASVGATGTIFSVVSYDNTTGKLRVRTVDPDTAGAPTAVDPANDDWVHVQAIFAKRDALNKVAAI